MSPWRQILPARKPPASAASFSIRAASSQPQASPRPYPPPATHEAFWPAQLTVLGAIGLQLLLPARLTVGPYWLIPVLEALLLIGMFVATPRQLEHEHLVRRRLALGLTALVSAANIYSLARAHPLPASSRLAEAAAS